MADINLTAEQVAALILSIGDKSKLKTAEKKTLVDAINNLIDSNLSPTSVLYTPMELSNESKEQARENIGAGVEEYRIPLSYDEESGEWSTIITPQNLYSAYSTGKRISAYVDLSPISTIKDKKTFRAETIRATRGTASGTFVSVDTDKITKLIFHTSEDHRSFAITEETSAITSPLYIRGTYDPETNTFTPETDYTVQEINDAFIAGRYVAVVVSNYIVPLVNSDIVYAEFNLNKSDPRDLSTYVYINVVRTLSGWEIVFDES